MTKMLNGNLFLKTMILPYHFTMKLLKMIFSVILPWQDICNHKKSVCKRIILFLELYTTVILDSNLSFP